MTDEEKVDTSRLLQTPEGRHLLWRILEQCGVYRSSFTGDPHQTAFLEGQRSIGLWIMSEIVLTDGFDVFNVMSKEAEARNEKHKAEMALDDD